MPQAKNARKPRRRLVELANEVSLTATTVTANAGTDLNTSALALESGGNLDTIAGDTTSLDGKLPATAALADNTANPTLSKMASYPHYYDGSTWDRVLGNSTDGMLVNLGSNNDVIQGTHDNLNANANVQHSDADATAANPLPVGIFDDGSRQARIDDATDCLMTVDYAHHEIHAGSGYMITEVDELMANNDTIVIAFKTADATKWIHILAGYIMKGAGHLEVVEGPTWDSSSGSQETIYNHNRNSGNTSNVLEDTTGSFAANNAYVLNPTSFAGGTVVYQLYTFSGKSETTHSRNTEEIVLKQDTAYGFVLTADEAANAGEIVLHWYEHTNR